MNRLVFLVLSLLLAFPAAPFAHDLARVDTEAAELAQRLELSRKPEPQPRQAALLASAATIMRQEGQCREALGLANTAIAFGRFVDAAVLTELAEFASCAREWSTASHAAALASKAAATPAEQQRPLLLLGQALEQRTRPGDDWRPAALAVYERLFSLSKEAEIGAKAEGLRRMLGGEHQLAVKGISARNDGIKSALCLEFNDSVPRPEAGDSRYADFLRFTPSFNATFTASGTTLCAEGAGFGTAYAVTVKKGLELATKTLADSLELTVGTGQRKAELWFNANAYVLPLASQAGIGLFSVNTDEVSLQLYRIHERNILGDFVRYRFRGSLNQYSMDEISERVGEKIWEGTTRIDGERNAVVSSTLVLPETVTAAPGLYVLAASDGKNRRQQWQEQATQWLVVTDIGLTTYLAEDGLTVIARSLASAKPLAGVEVTLTASNNSPLGVATTDRNGVVHFAAGLTRGTGGLTPMLVTAAAPKAGFSFLQLNQASLDLSDRGVSGRPAVAPLDLFLYCERGIYRPGETVNLTMLLRDHQAKAVDGLPLTVRLIAPDGKPALERLVQPRAFGGYTVELPLARGLHTGGYTIAVLLDPKEKPLGETSFRLEAFRPPRLEATLTADGRLQPELTLPVRLQADYLFGSPGSELAVSATLSFTHDPHPFGDHPGFWFGRAGEEVTIAPIELEGPEMVTDSAGGLDIPCLIKDLVLPGQPLKATLEARVQDIDGRSVTATADLPVRHLQRSIGIKPLYSGERAPAGGPVSFQVAVLDGEGQPAAVHGISYRLVEEEIDYQWFKKGATWGYERFVRDQEVLRQPLPAEGAPYRTLTVPVATGEYRLELFSTEGETVTSFRFSAGDQVSGTGDTPDMVKVTLDRPTYRAGEVAQLTISAPFAGEASLVLAGSKFDRVEHFPVGSAAKHIQIPVRKEWGGGVYALVTVHRPGQGPSRPADRAVGLVWIGIEPTGQRLDLAIEAPERVAPRQRLEVGVTVRGAAAGERTLLTLAAVDDGVLQLTGYAPPDPLAYCFGKQRLGTAIRDLYGRLITAPDQKPLILREGAGDEEGLGAPSAAIRVVSLFSGLVETDSGGKALIPLDLPDFNGRLRLMAVAWNREMMGAANRTMQVSDPVVVTPSLPRFLAEGDTAEVTVLLQHIDGAEGAYALELTADGAVAPAGVTRATVVLAAGQRRSQTFSLSGAGLGQGTVRLRVEGPRGFAFSGDYPLAVRGRHLPVRQRFFHQIEPGATLAIDPGLVKGLVMASATVTVGLSSAPGLDVPALFADLAQYPYECLEQQVSRGMARLFAGKLAERWGLAPEQFTVETLGRTVEAVFQKQLADGSFGLWSDADDTEPWLSAYAMDFLGQAKAQGAVVPDYFYSRGLSWLAGAVRVNSPQPDTLPFLAYAHYVLARAGQGKAEEARYLFDTLATSARSSLAVAQLSGALALQGEMERARKGFARALVMDEEPAERTLQTFGTPLRDLAGVLHLLHVSGRGLADPAAAWQRLLIRRQATPFLSTQEQAWLVLAAAGLEPGSVLQLEIDGKRRDHGKDGLTLTFTGGELNQQIPVVNRGTAPVWAVISVHGIPLDAPAQANRFTLERRIFDRHGDPLEGGTVRQGDLFVVLLKGEHDLADQRRALVVDLLPAGFEIDKVLDGTEETDLFPWLPPLSDVRYADGLDDRFIAAIDVPPPDRQEPERHRFAAAYLVRAVTPGSYVLPPAEVEEMYFPAYRARTGTGRITVDKAVPPRS